MNKGKKIGGGIRVASGDAVAGRDINKTTTVHYNQGIWVVAIVALFGITILLALLFFQGGLSKLPAASLTIAPLPSKTPPPLVTSATTPPEVIYGNWQIDYYTDINLNGSPVWSTSVFAVKNEKGGYTLQSNSIDNQSNPKIPGGNWSVRYTGIFYFSADNYHFHCQHHDGCRIYIDGKNWIDAWWEGEAGQDMARDLSAGTHTVVIEYYDKSGLGFLEAWWELNN